MSKHSSQQQIEILKKNFNNYSVTLSTFLANLLPDSSFKIYKPFIEELANENSNKLIDTFVLSILKYEKYIMEEDENFFLGKKNYDDDLRNDNGVATNQDYKMKVFEFKSIWALLNEENKSIIKSYMKLLCRIARKYFDIVCENKKKY